MLGKKNVIRDGLEYIVKINDDGLQKIRWLEKTNNRYHGGTFSLWNLSLKLAFEIEIFWRVWHPLDPRKNFGQAYEPLLISPAEANEAQAKSENCYFFIELQKLAHLHLSHSIIFISMLFTGTFM